jgi:S-adenosylmethionine:tRNA ribosyltransferase-isomerase
VYAQALGENAHGSVAAPTAGLHFDTALLGALDARGVRRCELTLHVGAGTFSPVRVSDLREHQMHSEPIHVPASVLNALASAKHSGARRISVGTTSLRALESVPAGQTLDFDGETAIFIRPGYQFQRVDGLLTNFHLPQSTLLVLLCAFGGQELIMRAYAHAIAQRYRFYSYGDAMLVLPGALSER